MAFKSFLDIRHIEGTEQYKLLRDLIYISNNGFKWIILKGFKSDGHSIPQLLRSIAGSPFATKFPRSAWLHDYLLWRIPRKKADLLYKEAMASEGATKFQQIRNYYGVRVGAFFGWLTRR